MQQVRKSAGIRRLPLRGKTVLVTRPEDQAEEFVQLLRESGANVEIFATIRIVPPRSWDECDKAIVSLDTYDAFIATSANAVKMFLQRLEEFGQESPRERFKDRSFYVVGTKTGETLAAAGVTPTLLTGVTDGRTLATRLLRFSQQRKRYLFPKGNLASDELSTKLREHGAVVDDVTVYETVNSIDQDLSQIRKKFLGNEIDVVTFFSPSSVNQFAEAISPEVASSTTIAAIGKSTADAARSKGFIVKIVPDRPGSSELVQAIVQYFNE